MDLNEPVFWDKNNKRLGRNSAILSSGLHQIWRLSTKLYSAVYVLLVEKDPALKYEHKIAWDNIVNSGPSASSRQSPYPDG